MSWLVTRCARPAWFHFARSCAVAAACAAPAIANDDGPPAASHSAPGAELTRVATASPSVVEGRAHAAARPALAADPQAEAKQIIAQSRDRYRQLNDYTCTLYKRERIDGRLTSQHVMHLKARTRPQSVYLKFVQPNAGREAIYVAGRNNGRAIVHDVGLGRLLAGAMHLDPKSRLAMEDCRHPITEAGLGFLIETVETAWAAEMAPGDMEVTIHHNAHVGDRPCTLVDAVHPDHRAGWMFHRVKLYVDRESGLPIRYEGYDWPRQPGAAADLAEEYTYSNLKLNVGLTDSDFDPSNKQYQFKRF